MKKLSDNYVLWLEAAFMSLIPFIVLWAATPTNILNSNFLFKQLEIIGICGSGAILFAGIPVGVVGLKKAKEMIRLRKTAITMSIINLFAAGIEILLLLSIFCAVVFGGASV